MEEPVFDTNNPTVLEAQLRLIRSGQAEFNQGQEFADEAITEEDYALLQEGKYTDLSLKKQYWINRYYKLGMKQKSKSADKLKKMYDKPITVGEASAFLFDMIHGKDGLKEDIDRMIGTLRTYVAILGEALEMKGLITPEDVIKARDSLQAKAEAMAAKAAEEAKAEVTPEETPTNG